MVLAFDLGAALGTAGTAAREASATRRRTRRSGTLRGASSRCGRWRVQFQLLGLAALTHLPSRPSAAIRVTAGTGPAWKDVSNALLAGLTAVSMDWLVIGSRVSTNLHRGHSGRGHGTRDRLRRGLRGLVLALCLLARGISAARIGSAGGSGSLARSGTRGFLQHIRMLGTAGGGIGCFGRRPRVLLVLFFFGLPFFSLESFGFSVIRALKARI